MKRINIAELLDRAQLKSILGGYVAEQGDCKITFVSPGEPQSLPTANIVQATVSGTCAEQILACSTLAATYVGGSNSNVHYDTACDN